MCFVRTKKNIELWISNKLGIKLKVTDSMKILGYIERNKYYWPINLVILVKSKLGFYVPFNSQGHIGTGPQNCHLWDSNPQSVILVTKKYIYWCSKKGFMLNIYCLQKEIRKIFDEQRALAKVNLN